MAITIDRIIKVTGSVISSGFQEAALIGNFLTENILVPADVNRTLSFTSSTEVGDYFGTTSNEYSIATTYFKGYNNSLTKPASILFSRYVQSATAAYMFSAQLAASATVTAIKALTTPGFVAHINGVTQTLTLVQADFAAATGLTDIAAVIESALDDELAGATCSIVGTNQVQVQAPTSGASTSTITFCTGNVADLLGLVSADNPTLSQGTPGGNAAYNMNLIVNGDANWIALSYVTRLTGDAIDDDYAVTVDLTAWLAAQTNTNYVGFWWEGGTPPTSPASTTNMRAILVDEGYGTRTPDNSTGQVTYNVPIQVDYNGLDTVNSVTTDEIGTYSAFYMGMGASINYSLVNGKINFAGKSQSGLAVNVNDTTTYDALLLQGYNIYGNFATRASSYQFTENGSVGGAFQWMDNLYDSVWLTDQNQNVLATLLGNIGRLPYNDVGQAQVRAVMTGVVQQATANGVIEPGNQFTPTQIQEIISLVGVDISPLLTQNGYYIFFPPITALQRINRTPLFVYLLYTNGGAINQINIGQVFVA